MSKQTDEKRELLKLKQGLIEESEIIEEDVPREKTKLTGFKWFENFMYRNKWYVIVGGFLCVMLVFMVYQTITREKADLTVLLVTSDNQKTPALYQKVQDVELAMEKYCPDFDNNGNIHVDVFYIDLTLTQDPQLVNSNNAKFFGELQRGVAELIICDEGIFNTNDEGAEDFDDEYVPIVFDDVFTDLYEVTGNEEHKGQTTLALKDTPFVKEAKWENSCPDVLRIGLKAEKEGMMSYGPTALQNNEKAKEVLNNILNNNIINNTTSKEG